MYYFYNKNQYFGTVKIKLFLILNLLFFVSFNLQAQVTASFTADPMQGCAPLQVNFTNNSTGTGTLTYLWNFGNGNSSVEQNPFTQTYSIPGSYIVTLIVSNGTGQSDTESLTINVNAPTAQFSSGVHIGCDQLTVQFTDQSTGAATWSWDFGDGSGSSTPSPSHTYSTPGIYTVSLRVYDAGGCYDDFFITDYVIVSQSPNSNFSADITSYCVAPITINFAYTPQTSSNFTYNWTFGDGGTANVQNPSHLYDTIGLYDVSLTVTNQYGCTSNTSINDFINLTTVSSSFYFTEGDTVCPYNYIHLNNTSGISGFWVYPDGTMGTVDSIVFNPGFIGNISFIAAAGTSCADTSTRQIVVTMLPVTNFIMDEHYGCKVPHIVHFTNQSPTAVTWAWNFGDGGDTTIASPTHTYLSQGTFTVGLTITNQRGCMGFYQDFVTITFPVADFINDTNLGCIPLPIEFTDASTCNSTFDTIPIWNWNFGDPTSGALNTSSIPIPTHIFATDGDFTVHLTITTQHGCSVSDSMIVNIGSHQVLAFTIDTIVACAQDTIKITNLTQDITKIDTYSWTFGTSITSTLQDPLPFVLKNTVDTGWADFTLITNYNGCRDTLIDSAYIKGPIIKTISIVTSLMHCGYDSSYVYYLTTNTQGAEYWKWNWRDSITSTADSVTYDTLRHQYLSSGNRTVSIWAYNDSTGCIYKDSIVVKPRDIHANLQFNDTMCYTPPINAFTGLTLKDAVDWKWKFGDATPTTAWSTNQTSTHTFDTTGYYLVWMYARTDNELLCIDSTSKYVRIFKPEVEFYADTLIGCAQSPFTVPFHSTSFSPDTNIVSWSWNLGDNTFSVDTFFTHAYPTPGKYNITLQIIDGFGCMNSLSKTEYIKSLAVTANFSTPQTVYCINEGIQFSSMSTYIPSDFPPTEFHWFFGNGDSSYLDSPFYPYPVKGTYDVILVVYNALGCYDTIIKTDYIEAQTIIASFTLDTTSTCYPFPITNFVNNTLTEYNPLFTWHFGDGAIFYDTAIVTLHPIPVHSYSLPGNYYMVLEASTSNICQDKDSVLIHVGGPYASITLDQTQICKSDTIVFNIAADSISVSTFTWDFGDGAGITNVSPTSHSYNYVPTGGTFTVSLFYNSPLGDCPKTADTVINVYQVMADFNRIQQGSILNDTSGCNPLPIVFSDLSTGATIWNWNFGDGSSSNIQTPSAHSFVNSTQNNLTYTISLIILNSIGCTDTSMKTVIVNPTPNILLLNDTVLCRGSNIVLLSLGGDSIRWDYDSTLSTTIAYNPIATPSITTTYTATVTSNYGCFNKDSVKVFVQQVPILTTSPDTLVIIGEYVDLYAIPNPPSCSYQWTPNPNDISMTCTNCLEPTVRPMKTTNYTIRITDSLGCFSVEKIVKVIVDARFSVDVPKVFTPNDDGHNDIIFAKGWGVESMKQFKIFNRWGQLIFETNDIHAGWNGMFNGKRQPSETYTYFVEMNMLDGTSLSKKGTFDLLR